MIMIIIKHLVEILTAGRNTNMATDHRIKS